MYDDDGVDPEEDHEAEEEREGGEEEEENANEGVGEDKDETYEEEYESSTIKETKDEKKIKQHKRKRKTSSLKAKKIKQQDDNDYDETEVCKSFASKNDKPCASCCICLEDATQYITCAKCHIHVCKQDVVTLVLSSTSLTTKCINPEKPGCDQDWTMMLRLEMPEMFHRKAYKKHRSELLFQRERALLSTSQDKAANMLRAKELKKLTNLIADRRDEAEQISLFYKDLQVRHKATIFMVREHGTILSERDLLQFQETYDQYQERSLKEKAEAANQKQKDKPTIVEEKKKEEEKDKIVCACPSNDCRGFVMSKSAKCAICSTGICLKCEVACSSSTHREPTPDELLAYTSLVDARKAHEKLVHQAKSTPQIIPVSENDKYQSILDQINQLLKSDTVHYCDADTVASITEKRAGAKLCPKCHTLIYRPYGCDHMFCTFCNYGFDWKTLKPVKESANTNPYLYELRESRRLQQQQQQQASNSSQQPQCDQMLNVLVIEDGISDWSYRDNYFNVATYYNGYHKRMITTLSEMKKLSLASSLHDKWHDGFSASFIIQPHELINSLEESLPMPPRSTAFDYFDRTREYLNHLWSSSIVQYANSKIALDVNNSNTFEDIRIRYLTKDIKSEEQFQRAIFNREKNALKTCDIRDILHSWITLALERWLSLKPLLKHKIITKGIADDQIYGVFNELNELRVYHNQQLKRVSLEYHCGVPVVTDGLVVLIVNFSQKEPKKERKKYTLKKRKTTEEEAPVSISTKWECSSCTFENEADTEECSMCTTIKTN
jgi:hypothetical protein